MSANDYIKNYKKISDTELQRSYLVARYSPGTIDISDIYGTTFIDKNTSINNSKDITKIFTDGKCVKKMTSTFPKQTYNIVNPDGSKADEHFTNEYVRNRYNRNNINNYNFYI